MVLRVCDLNLAGPACFDCIHILLGVVAGLPHTAYRYPRWTDGLSLALGQMGGLTIWIGQLN